MLRAKSEIHNNNKHLRKGLLVKTRGGLVSQKFWVRI